MRTSKRILRSLCALSLAFAMHALGACAAPATNGDAQADAATAAPTSASPASPATQDEAPVPRNKGPMRTGGPLPPQKVERGTPVELDFSCKVDADCAVKNVGNCCGQFPACVNRDSPTDPEGVQAECAKSGMMSVCGWAEISACTCNQGKCEAQAGEVVR